MHLISLQLKTSQNFSQNLSQLIKHIKKSPKNSLILAPELFLTGYSYNNLQIASEITIEAIKTLKHLSKDKIIALTMTTKVDTLYYNTFFIFSKNEIMHTQNKVKLFDLNKEQKYFTKGKEKNIVVQNINGIKIATLICFELRFVHLWEKLKGADIILIPAMWGKQRKQNFESLCNALAIVNQCYVIASNSANGIMAKGSAIITPFGKVTQDDTRKMISSIFNKNQITKMRKYLYTGIN